MYSPRDRPDRAQSCARHGSEGVHPRIDLPGDDTESWPAAPQGRIAQCVYVPFTSLSRRGGRRASAADGVAPRTPHWRRLAAAAPAAARAQWMATPIVRSGSRDAGVRSIVRASTVRQLKQRCRRPRACRGAEVGQRSRTPDAVSLASPKHWPRQEQLCSGALLTEAQEHVRASPPALTLGPSLRPLRAQGVNASWHSDRAETRSAGPRGWSIGTAERAHSDMGPREGAPRGAVAGRLLQPTGARPASTEPCPPLARGVGRGRARRAWSSAQLSLHNPP